MNGAFAAFYLAVSNPEGLMTMTRAAMADRLTPGSFFSGRAGDSSKTEDSSQDAGVSEESQEDTASLE
jgi:hypothetical protein